MCTGDCVYVRESRRVVIRDSTLQRGGRQCLAVVTGRDVLIETNTIGDSRRGVTDIEPYGKDWATISISIIGNRLGGSRLLLLPMGGSGTIGSVFIADNVNTEHNGTPAVLNRGKPGQQRGPFVMVNNRLTIGVSPAPGRGQLEHVALADVAPCNDDSGQRRGQRRLRGGRATVQKALNIATLVATRYNPVIRDYYQHLQDQGNPTKVALVACMRKLLIRLNTILDEPKHA